MKTQANNPFKTTAIAAVAALTLLLTGTQAQGQHFFDSEIRLSGPNGFPGAHIGDRVDVHVEIWNFDGFFDTMTVNSVFVIIQHGSGDVRTPNLASNGVVRSSFEAADFFTNFIVQTNDGDELSVRYEARWTDNWDGIGVIGSPLSHSASEGAGIRLLRPALGISQECHLSPAYPFIAFDGVVTNTGNTPLYNVVVVSDNGTPTNLTDDRTTTLGVLNPTGVAPYAGNFTATPLSSSNTVTVRGTDAMGLTVTHSYTQAIPVTLRIARSGTDAVRISWPGWAEDFQLQYSIDAGRKIWTNVTNAPTRGDAEVFITLPISANQFFRLARP